jgi:hypothetical protein
VQQGPGQAHEIDRIRSIHPRGANTLSMRSPRLVLWVTLLVSNACASGGPGAATVADADEPPGSTGGSPATGGSGTGGGATGGSPGTPDAALAEDAGATGGSPATPDAAMADAAPVSGGGMVGFYEAEAVMPAGPNQILAPAVISNCPFMSPTCGAPETVMPETQCCFGGKEVRQLLRGRGGLVFNKVMAPADGTYDVTWYYRCGKNDNFGDGNCGGEPNHPAGGCRPHILTVNGTRLPKVYEFHCFPGPWSEVHIVTTPIPLKSGENSIRVVATTGRDAADLDAIAIYPEGKGRPPMAFAH